MKRAVLFRESFVLTELKGLDPILVAFQDMGPSGRRTGEHQGRVIIECHGRAWSCYFNAMAHPIREFVANAPPDYLLNALTPNGRRPQHEAAYLTRIIQEVQDALKPEPRPAGDWCFSWDEESYRGPCDTREDAIAEAVEELASQEPDADHCYIGQTVPFELNGERAAEAALELLEEHCHEHVGEISETWNPSQNEALVARIGAAIEAAVMELDRPTVFGVKGSQRYDFTPEELREGRGE